MKRKHQGILSAGLIFLLAGASVLYFMYGPWREKRREHLAFEKPLPEMPTPGPADIKKLQKLDAKMADLAFPHRADNSPVNLGLFGYRPERENNDFKAKIGDDVPVHKKDYVLTFAFASGKNRFCIIDGEFHSEGSTLSDGGTIVKIETVRVLIRKENLSRWIRMTEVIPITG
jgi:hypothetical protein